MHKHISWFVFQAGLTAAGLSCAGVQGNMAAAAAALANSLGAASCGMGTPGVPQSNPLLGQYAALLGLARSPSGAPGMPSYQTHVAVSLAEAAPCSSITRQHMICILTMHTACSPAAFRATELW